LPLPGVIRTVGDGGGFGEPVPRVGMDLEDFDLEDFDLEDFAEPDPQSPCNEADFDLDPV
jgi:hypothetical protein